MRFSWGVCFMLRAAIYGYGNIGRFVFEALLASPDFEIAGIVSRHLSEKELNGVKVTKSIDELENIDVAIICAPSRSVPELAASLLKKGICTVDSFDIHGSVCEVRSRLNTVAKESGTSAIMAAGWDPGSDSVIRTLMEAMAPKGITYTNFGPGMSMGHTVAVKAIKGVKNALSMTIPVGTGIHRRMVYIELEEGFELSEVAAAIKADEYFCHDETHVFAVESVDALKDMGHGVELSRKGVSGTTDSQRMCFTMQINNPALTAQILVAAARAVKRQAPGCYTLIEIPPVDLLSDSRENAVKRLV